MRTLILIIFSGAISLAIAQPVVPPKEGLVDCKTLVGLSASLLRNINADVRCRLERRDVTCVPGTTLTVDVTKDIDLCVNADKRPVTHPYCTAGNPAIYRQKVIQRGRFTVDLPDGRSEVRLLDLPFTTTGRKENLAQTAPIKRPGPDACVYIQKQILYHAYPRGAPLERATKPATPKP